MEAAGKDFENGDTKMAYRNYFNEQKGKYCNAGSNTEETSKSLDCLKQLRQMRK